MADLVDYAKSELDYIGMKESDTDDVNSAMRKHILHIVQEFHNEGHSGFSAHYAINCLEKLLRYQPLSALTGDDNEWIEIAEDQAIGGKLWQNKRCFRVFKDENGAYDSEGIIFYRIEKDEEGKDYKSHFTSSDSRVWIDFPYVPTQQYQLKQDD
jgi:hypothetical protein